MKRVLIITYYFPPSGGPGVQRVLKFTKYLPLFGWEPIVLTVRDGDYPARDESLLGEIPASLKVFRTPIFEPYNLYRKLTGKKPGSAVDVDNIPQKGGQKRMSESIAEFIRSTIFIPDARIGWMLHAVREAKEIIRKEKIDAIYSSSPPYTCAMIARKVSKERNIPWIAGFRDPWTGFLSAPQRWAIPRMIDEHFERECFQDATRIEVAWKGIMFDIQKKYPGVPQEKITHLPNGFDNEDFPEIPYRRNEKFTVTYTGSMYGVRNPDSFLRAVANLIGKRKIDPKKVLLQFIGRFGAEVQEMFRRPEIASCISVMAYQPHKESIERLLRSEALLLVVDEYKGSEEIVPGKVFEYIGARRPIIAIAPEGAIADLMRTTASGRVAHNSDIPAIEEIFLEYYDRYQYHSLEVSSNSAITERYERKEITRQLARLLDEIT